MCVSCVGSVAQSCPTLCDPIDCSPPGSSFQGILQARVLEQVAIFFSRGVFLTQGLNSSLMPLALASGFFFLFSFFFPPVSHLGSLIPKEGRGIHPVGGKEQVLPGESAYAKAVR